MAKFKNLVAEVDESGDPDKMAMFADALPKQQKMLMESGILILPFFRQIFRIKRFGGSRGLNDFYAPKHICYPANSGIFKHSVIYFSVVYL